MTAFAVLILVAFLLIAAWRLGRLLPFAVRLAAVFVLSLFATAGGRIATTQSLAPLFLWIAAAGIVTGGVMAAVWLFLPLRDGIDDYFAALDGIADEQKEQP